MDNARHPREANGFTLVELLVSMTVIAIMLLVLSQMTNALRTTISRTTSQIEEFRDARNAFETITRRIGQATLNAYDDLDPTAGSTAASSYVRASELRFRTGLAATLFSSPPGVTGALANLHHPTGGIFFQAPLGVSTTSSTNPAYAGLNRLLNTCGYYIEWNSDQSLRPSFLPNSIPFRYRLRLMEMIEPSDSLTIYNYTSGLDTSVSTPPPRTKSWGYTTSEWFQTPLSLTTPPVHFVAENVIFLALLPMVSPSDTTQQGGASPDGTSTDLAPKYSYDSSTANNTPDIRNKLPPMVYVMMIAVDERSFSRYQATLATGVYPTALGLDGILTDASYTARTSDVATVTKNLATYHIDYRIFTASIPLTPN